MPFQVQVCRVCISPDNVLSAPIMALVDIFTSWEVAVNRHFSKAFYFLDEYIIHISKILCLFAEIILRSYDVCSSTI